MKYKSTQLPVNEVDTKWDHNFIALSDKLLEAKSCLAFVEILNQCDLDFVKISVINLVIHDYLGAGCTIFSINPETRRGIKLANPGCLLPTHDNGEREIINLMEGEYFTTHFPVLKSLKPYSSLQSYCQFPLTSGTHLGGIEYISYQARAFSDEILKKLKQLSYLITTILNSVLRRERYSQQAVALRSERDYCQILVDVTNAVISQDNIESLITDLSGSLRTYFDIEYVSLKYFSKKLNVFECYTIRPGKDSRVAYTIEDAGNKCAHELEALNTLEPQFICNNTQDELNGICILPLIFRNQPHGVIRLGHRECGFFHSCDLALLQKIAARTAMTLHSVQVYQKEHISAMPLNRVSLDTRVHKHQVFSEIISQSSVMNQVLEKASMVADSQCTVLILGETGTGKELVARAIHRLSQRSSREMVKMNCSAVPSGLFESDLFGHEKGAFTGALARRAGRFERADQSTLFLDEIGDMPLDLQPKMLRVLQESEVERIGSYQPVSVDVRVIAATNCDLLKMVKDKKFRSDLYYRLNVFPIMLPPLRKRRDDIPLLVKHFTEDISRKMNRNITSISEDDMTWLCAQPWPGNIRELRNVIERSVILTRGNVLNVSYQEARTCQDTLSALPGLNQAEPDDTCSYDSFSFDQGPHDREAIIQALKACNGVVAGPRGAAQRLGIKRTTLLSRMKRLGISPKAPS
ncbi:sigma 54-interacting transcriptional regulator [Endozoicomonas sp. Mp262]|uniref:sigma 54-interacting transcriptional regulator n=1 Tax=Endozoicomonas sp. Mp262 TaxID=2919499 RepID=UPI0021DB5FC8